MRVRSATQSRTFGYTLFAEYRCSICSDTEKVHGFVLTLQEVNNWYMKHDNEFKRNHSHQEDQAQCDLINHQEIPF